MTPDDIDKSFHARALGALGKNGQSAIEFMSSHPRMSLVDMAKLLNEGCNALGLVSVIYEESRSHCIRQTALDLLVREIINEYPQGWDVDDECQPSVVIGSWYAHITKYASDYRSQAREIIRELAIINPPHAGWLPELHSDPLLTSLFEKHWPIAMEE